MSGRLFSGGGRAATLFQLVALGCGLVVRSFLMSSEFVRIFVSVSESVVLVDASLATRSSFCQLDRYEVGTFYR